MDERLTPDGCCLDEYSENSAYANVFYGRATGTLPEMECSKAIAQLVAERSPPAASILDVGCGGGHYLRSLKRAIPKPFQYVGIDYYPIMVAQAERAWGDDPNAGFRLGSIFNLPVSDGEFDIVICSNLLMHLPSIVKPVGELIRAGRRAVIIRTMIGDRSFRIQEVLSSSWWRHTNVASEDEFDESGEPRSFSYENIYLREYFSSVVRRHAPNAGISYIEDRSYDPKNIQKSADTEGLVNATRMVDGKQVFGYIILPYVFVIIDLQG